MYYYSKKAKEKVVHLEGCRHLEKIREDNLAEFHNVKEAIREGYRVCACCSPLVKSVRNEYEVLAKFSQRNGLSFYLKKDGFYIESNYSKWKVVLADGKKVYELHHKNTFEKEDATSFSGYHNQNLRGETLMEIAEYITNHEWYRMINPLRIKHKVEEPLKGTKKWRKKQKAFKRVERRKKVWDVINLINSMSVSACTVNA